MPHRSRESRLERNAWTGFVFISLLIFLFGLGDVFTGGATFGQGEAPTVQGITGVSWADLSTTPAAALINWKVRAQAIYMMFVGVLSAMIAANGFRRGERWAWFAMAGWPIAIAAVDLNLLSAYRHSGSSIPPPLISGAVLIVLSITLLAAGYRRAFRRTA